MDTHPFRLGEKKKNLIQLNWNPEKFKWNSLKNIHNCKEKKKECEPHLPVL